MLAFFRKLSQSWVAKILLGLLVVSFGFWGIKDVVHPRFTNAVLTAGSHEVGPEEFRRIYDNYIKDAQQQTGQTLTPAEAVAQGIDVRVADAIASDESMAELSRRLGLAPSDSQVADQIKQQPAFFDPVTGKFDPAAYQRALDQIGFTPAQFQQTLGDELAQDQFATGLQAGLREPLAYGALVASYELQGLNLSYFLLDPHNVLQPTPPTDAQLQDLIKQHADQLRHPEMRLLTVVRLSVKTLAPSLTPDPAALQKLYDFRKDSLSTPETRSLVEIPAKDVATAKAIAAKLQAGQAPDEVAKAFGVHQIDYANQPRGAIADQKVGDAAFTMSAGQVSGPVQTSLAGLAVIKVGAVTPGKTPTLDEAKPQLLAQARTDMATKQVYAEVRKYDDAHDAGDNLAKSAGAAGAVTIQLGPVTANGADAQNQPVPGLSPKLLQTAFGLAQGGESDLLDDGKGEYFAVRVDKVVAPALPTVDEIRKPLTQFWMSQEMMRRLNAKADELTAKMHKGESLDAAAAEVLAQVRHAVGVTRASMQQHPMVSEELAGKLFSAKVGDVVTGPTTQMAVMVGRIDAITAAPPAAAAPEVVARRAQDSTRLFNDLGQLVRVVAKSEIKPVYDLARVREAIGAPDDAAAAPVGGKPTSTP